jgi:hypothetical protein
VRAPPPRCCPSTASKRLVHTRRSPAPPPTLLFVRVRRRFGGSDDADFDTPLHDWAAAERVLVRLATSSTHVAPATRTLGTTHSHHSPPDALELPPLGAIGHTTPLAIQAPPLGYSDELARRAALASGKGWYFSVADFDAALLHGLLTLKPTCDEDRHGVATMVVDLTRETVHFAPYDAPGVGATAACAPAAASPSGPVGGAAAHSGTLKEPCGMNEVEGQLSPKGVDELVGEDTEPLSPKPSLLREESPSSIIDVPFP